MEGAETVGKGLRRADISGVQLGVEASEEIGEGKTSGIGEGEGGSFWGKWRRPSRKSRVTECVLRKSDPRIG
jgi:hypothetical protein